MLTAQQRERFNRLNEKRKEDGLVPWTEERFLSHDIHRNELLYKLAKGEIRRITDFGPLSPLKRT